jgi:hypothetical protein
MKQDARRNKLRHKCNHKRERMREWRKTKELRKAKLNETPERNLFAHS